MAIHRPTTVFFSFTVQQINGGVLTRTFTLHTAFPMPVPERGERVAYGPSNGAGDDGNAIIGFVVRKQYSVDVIGDTLRIVSVIDVE